MLAIIPARGGSKRIERKNVKDFAGKPVIAWSIQAALEAGCFSEVMVSTDDAEIAAVAESLGAKVPFMRSAETANDFATTADVIREVLDRYESMGRRFDALCCIYATAPFITTSRLLQGAGIIRRGEAEAAFTCVEYSYPIQRSLAIGADGRIAMKFPEYANSRSQDLAKSYHDAGQFYYTKVDAFRQCGSLWGPDTMPIVLPEMEVQDLDTPQDWLVAEAKFRVVAADRQLTLPERIETPDFIFTSYTLLDDAESEMMRIGRNDPEVRRNSFTSQEISASAHKSFVNRLKTNPALRYYSVRSRDGRLVGSVNLHRPTAGRVTRGIWIAADARGQGFAPAILCQLYSQLPSMGIFAVDTEVLLHNAPSHSLERKLGATLREELTDCIRYELYL